MSGNRIWSRKSVIVPGLLILVVLLGLVVFTRPTQATPGSGVTAELISSGTLTRAAEVEVDSMMGKGKTDATQVQTYKITLAPGAITGWHQHGGPHMIIVASGTLVYYHSNGKGCMKMTYPAGSAIIDPGFTSHFVRNDGSTDAVTYVTQLLPVGGKFRVDIPDPGTCDLSK